jgi:hypothetical protein
VAALTAPVVTGNVAEVEPAGTVTLAGTLADVLLSDRVTAAPPAGATPLSVTVAVEVSPPTTLAGLSARDDTVVTATSIPSTAVRVTPA